MSYRELRGNYFERASHFPKTPTDATEMLRSLGFPRLVSIDNFRLPNFPLMAEVLEWIVQKCEKLFAGIC